MSGPAPKSAATRQRRNRTSTAAVIEAVRALKTPLPERISTWKCASCYLLPGRHSEEFFDKEEIHPHDFVGSVVPWNTLTEGWWEVIWASPIADEWVDADVPGLVALAMLWDSFFRFGDARIHAEARMASREFGLSPMSRRSLQWEIKRVEEQRAPLASPSRARDPRLRAIS